MQEAAAGTQWVEIKHADKHPTEHRVAPKVHGDNARSEKLRPQHKM